MQTAERIQGFLDQGQLVPAVVLSSQQHQQALNPLLKLESRTLPASVELSAVLSALFAKAESAYQRADFVLAGGLWACGQMFQNQLQISVEAEQSDRLASCLSLLETASPNALRHRAEAAIEQSQYDLAYALSWQLWHQLWQDANATLEDWIQSWCLQLRLWLAVGSGGMMESPLFDLILRANSAEPLLAFLKEILSDSSRWESDFSIIAEALGGARYGLRHHFQYEIPSLIQARLAKVEALLCHLLANRSPQEVNTYLHDKAKESLQRMRLWSALSYANLRIDLMPEDPSSYRFRAKVHLRMGQYQAGFVDIQQALDKSNGAPMKHAELLLDAAEFAVLLDLQTPLEAYLNQAEILVRKHFGRRNWQYGHLLQIKASYHLLRNEPQKAIPLQKKALKRLHKQIASAPEQCLLGVLQMAGLYFQTGQIADAMAQYQWVEEQVEDYPSFYPFIRFQLLQLSGNLLQAMREIEAAQTAFQTVESLCRSLRLENSVFAAGIWFLQGNFLLEREAFREADLKLTMASVLMNQLLGPDHPMSLRVNMALGMYAFKTGKQKMAEIYLGGNLQSMEEQGHPVSIYADLAIIYAELLRYQQNYQEAKSLLRRLLPETQKRQGKSHATTVRMILKLAQIEADDNQYPIAKNLLARAEKQIDKKAHDSEDLNLDCRQLRVQLALYQGQHEQGLEQLSQMIASPKKKLSPSVLVGIQFQSALIYTQSQQWAAAQKAFANCLVYYESRSRHHLPYMSERGQWQLHTEWQLFLRAYLSFLLLPQNALPDRLSLAFQLRLDYKDYVMRFRRHYQPLMISNQSVDSKALWEEWQDSQLTLHRAMLVPEERLEQEGQFLHVLANVTDQKERLWRNSLQDQLPSYEIPKLPWQSLGQKLKKGEALLEIVANPIYGDKTDLGSKMGAFVLRYDQPDRLQYQAFREAEELLEKGEAKILASLFPQDERLRNLYFESLEEQIDPSELYHLFWRDIAPLLQGIERVYFSPDGPFHQLNPAMLSHKKGEYLEDTVEFVHLRHLHDWVKPTEVDKAPKQACIFANPDFALHPQKKAALLYQKGLASAEIGPNVKIVRRLSRLPGTLNEASQIVDLMSAKGIECRLFTEEHALEAEVHRQTKVDVLHFATHGYFDHESKREKRGSALGLNEAGLTEFPFYGAGLFLAGANYGIDESYNGQLNDGILFADEVSKMDLSAVQLVVLSACQTGQGEIAPGEGIFSLHTAFLQAGAQAVLFSLWEVGDTVSALFMTHFYKCWLGGKSKRLALCEARQYIKAQYPEPRDWAAFVLVEA